MTIKEIPTRPAPDDPSILKFSYRTENSTPEDANQEYWQTVLREQNKYFEEGVRLLESSGAIDSTKELISVIKPLFPDAGFAELDHGHRIVKKQDEPAYSSVNDGMLARALVIWNFEHDGENGEDYWRSLSIGMRVLTEELEIGGFDLRIIPKSVWNSEKGKKIIEDSICNGFINNSFWESLGREDISQNK